MSRQSRTSKHDLALWRKTLPEANVPVCIGNCGLAAAQGDVFCPGCREGYDRDPSFIMELEEK